ncbi:hypothetical protein [Pantanalinema sp. GBBB05]|uniref:hypothetical protein n=1 Tax=Pantanalinema sp. GBBB05 TaxID=2604139 RepID=UPI001E0FF53A|nr:hypothetical protein [Pantanalinema sp. GBBB05]
MNNTAIPAIPALDLKKSLTIACNGQQTEFLNPPRSARSQLREKFVELQSYWCESGFSTGDLLGNDRAWQLMKDIIALFPRKDNPAVTGFDLEPLQTDPYQLERLFLTQDKGEITAYRNVDDELQLNVFIDTFESCLILEFCCYEARLILQDANRMFRDRQDAKVEESITEPVKAEPERIPKVAVAAEAKPVETTEDAESSTGSKGFKKAA